MANIKVIDITGSPDLGKTGGDKLAKEVARRLSEQTDDVVLDFDGIHSVTPSASFRLFHRVQVALGNDEIQRMVFVNASPWVMERLEDTATYQLSH